MQARLVGLRVQTQSLVQCWGLIYDVLMLDGLAHEGVFPEDLHWGEVPVEEDFPCDEIPFVVQGMANERIPHYTRNPHTWMRKAYLQVHERILNPVGSSDKVRRVHVSAPDRDASSPWVNSIWLR